MAKQGNDSFQKILAARTCISEHCSAVNCHQQTQHGYRLFRFPANADQRKKWIAIAEEINGNRIAICEFVR